MQNIILCECSKKELNCNYCNMKHTKIQKHNKYCHRCNIRIDYESYKEYNIYLEKKDYCKNCSYIRKLI